MSLSEPTTVSDLEILESLEFEPDIACDAIDEGGARGGCDYSNSADFIVESGCQFCPATQTYPCCNQCFVDMTVFGEAWCPTCGNDNPQPPMVIVKVLKNG